MKEQRKGEEAPTEESPRERIRNSASRKKRKGPVVVGVVLLLLGLLFFFIFTDLGSSVFWGLGILLSPFVIRMGIEYAMSRKKQALTGEAVTSDRQRLISYHKARKNIHFIVTPVLFAAYIYGFRMLLSFLEQELLKEFHAYIMPSFWVVVSGLAVLIGLEIKKELDILKSMIAEARVS